MKTEQEQAQAMAELITNKDLLDDKGRLAGKVVFGADQLAVALVNAGYGDVAEYKIEIERLRQEVRDTDKMARNTIEQYKNNYDNAFERLKAQEREIERLKAKVKQAQIDILNKANERLNVVAREFGDDCDLCGVSAVCSCRCKINELIEEVQNAEDKG